MTAVLCVPSGVSLPMLFLRTNRRCNSYTWASEVCADDNEERALVIGSMNGFQYAVAAWLPIVTFPQLDAPTFRKGFPSTFGLVIAAIICVLVIQWFVIHDNKRKNSDSPLDSKTSSEGQVPKHLNDVDNENITLDGAKGKDEKKTTELEVISV